MTGAVRLRKTEGVEQQQVSETVRKEDVEVVRDGKDRDRDRRRAQSVSREDGDSPAADSGCKPGPAAFFCRSGRGTPQVIQAIRKAVACQGDPPGSTPRWSRIV